MNTSAIVQTQNLTKKYGSINSVNKVDLYVQEGEIYGFLGSNGAGKTTTQKMLLGLIKPSEGTINIFGESLNKCRSSILQRTGYLIESPMLEIQKAIENVNVLIESSNQQKNFISNTACSRVIR
ncbi:ATP-binding cassette domain-containing protein [Lysinibacillus xylanilyticus]|uniref:ATP-binding cassette domain-containing protein n=1 Tax=Lysinibacillus xylanilyticus TaxID=582475 RepID=UPI002B245C24|nr:ATP-binding cassette domain-containing protein [Lysinibacillus xylanilyticus]MEB2278814.1 ATP-binding cassette domain-containing protein [Lysinibacillus xylanilyticus]